MTLAGLMLVFVLCCVSLLNVTICALLHEPVREPDEEVIQEQQVAGHCRRATPLVRLPSTALKVPFNCHSLHPLSA